MTSAHFERWLELFRDTVELGWVGPNRQRALDLAENVAQVHHRQLVGTASRVPVDDQGGEGPCLLELVEDQRDH